MTDKVQWKTLPTKANRDMEQAGADAAREYLERTGSNNLWVIYEAMVAAAPKPPASAEPSAPATFIACRVDESCGQSAPVEHEPADCAICKDLGDQCMECEEAEFCEWADRHFASADYRKTDAGVYIQDWMRHAFAAWQARGVLKRTERHG